LLALESRPSHSAVNSPVYRGDGGLPRAAACTFIDVSGTKHWTGKESSIGVDASADFPSFVPIV
jgi:hypothetical protein